MPMSKCACNTETQEQHNRHAGWEWYDQPRAQAARLLRLAKVKHLKVELSPTIG